MTSNLSYDGSHVQCEHGAVAITVTSASVTKRRGPSLPRARVIAPEAVAALNRAVTSEPIASGSSIASVDRLIVSANVSTDAAEDQGQFRGE